MLLFSSKNLRLLLALSLSVLVALTACENPPAPSPSPSSYASPTNYPTPTVSPDMQPTTARPVIQINHGCPIMGPCIGGITSLIMWDDGRVVFESNLKFFEARLDTAQVASLIDAASFLYDLDDRVSVSSGFVIMEPAPLLLTVEAEEGHRKTVAFYRLCLDSEYFSGDLRKVDFINLSEIETLEKLQAFWEMVKESLPEDAPLMQPTEVFVQLIPCYLVGAVAESLSKWPSELMGYLCGDEAEESIRIGGLGYIGGYNIGGQAQCVRVVPVLPCIHVY